MNGQENVIDKKSFQFALEVIKFSETLEEQKKFVIAKKILRSGTSIEANIREAQHAESRQDFIHKLKIAAKEAEETIYWLDLCKESKNYPNTDFLPQDLLEIQKLLSSIISSSKIKGKYLN